MKMGCLKERRERMEMEAELLLKYKYGGDFRGSTLDKNIRRREDKGRSLGKVVRHGEADSRTESVSADDGTDE